MFNIAPGYEIVTLGFLALVDWITKFSGKLFGRTHQIPSVSSSSGLLERINRNAFADGDQRTYYKNLLLKEPNAARSVLNDGEAGTGFYSCLIN